MSNYVSLHNHTHWSILDSLLSPKDLLTKAKELGQKAVAITDHGTLASAWEAHKLAKEIGIKLIIGCEMYFVNDVTNKEEKFRHVILLAKNAIGYKNLLSLNKEGFDNSAIFAKKVYPVIDWKLLQKYSEGLICLTSCSNGIIAQLIMAKKVNEAEQQLLKLVEIFGKDNLGLEVQANTLKRNATIYNEAIEQVFINAQMIRLAKKHDLRAVATNNAHYLNKEDAETHDVLLAIGSHQPVHSNFRLKYSVPEFYVKSEDEIITFFQRNYGEYAQTLIDNSSFFADQCEEPIWIDPKYSNPSGKELPIFPVKDEPDYQEFLNWQQIQKEEIRKIAEDSQYLRFKCFKEFENKVIQNIKAEKVQEYIDRIEKELDILEYQGFSSYMLITADYLNWAKKHNIPIGPGRGCVKKDTLILTSDGFKFISDIKVGDKVYSHTGKLKNVLNVFEYPIHNEQILKIKSQKSFGTISLTKDHKILASKRIMYNSIDKYKMKRNWKATEEPAWISVSDLKKSDLVWTQYPKHDIKDFNEKVDLSKFCKNGKIADSYIEYIKYEQHILSTSSVAKAIGISATICNKIKKGISVRNNDIIVKKVSDYLLTHNFTLNSWRKLSYNRSIIIDRFIELNSDFYYILGLWIGDGFLINSSGKHGIGFSFHKDEIELYNKIYNFFTKIGVNVRCYSKKEQAIQVEVSSELIMNLFQSLINDYQNCSDTKHLPKNFRNLDKIKLRNLVNGIVDSDGSAQKSFYHVMTTSYRLALELKESLLFLKKASSIRKNKLSNSDGAIRKQSYCVSFTNFDFKENTNFYKSNGFFSRIDSIEEEECEKVYDIEVEEDHSYLTANFISHNSGGGSIIGYLLNIHKADPIEYDLLFERFQNKERKNAPDYDVDISTIGREKVINYIIGKYGKEHVAAISNFNRITPKVYVKDLSRCLDLGNDKTKSVEIGNNLADTIPSELIQSSNIEPLLKLPLFNAYCQKYPQITNHKNILNKPRSLSMHAAGLVIGRRSLVGLVPLRKDKDGSQVLEYAKEITEENGLIKMDLLGLSTLDLIESTLELVRKNKKIDININDIDFNKYDQKTYDLISRGDTYGVFQLGTSAGTIDLCKKVKPKSIEDLAIITTLARPAAANIRQQFIETREGKKKFSLLHPSLNNAFQKTFGFGLFDESILQLGRDVAGWSLNEADKIRKMIKEKGKNPEKDRKLREQFITDTVKNGISLELATRIWDEEIKKFASYTFNKSHAVMYSFISFQTAYLKAHYPLEFLLANLMAEVKSNSPIAEVNIAKIKKEIRALKVKILPPDLNKSEMAYSIIDSNTLLTGLDALKFVGDDAIQDIIEKRPFNSFFDFMVRVSSKKVRANTIQALASSGCLDIFGLSRKLIYLYCSDYRKKLQIWLKKHDPTKETFNYIWPQEKEWSLPELYALEKKYLGESFICDKTKAYGNFFRMNDFVPIAGIKISKDRTPIPSIRGEIKDIFEFKVKKETSKYYGQSMAKIVIEDIKGDQCSATIFPDRYEKLQEKIKQLHSKLKLEPGVVIHFAGITNLYEEEMGLILDNVFNIQPTPPLPADLKARKINLKTAKKEITSDEEKSLFEEVEDELINEGLLDIEEEE